MRRRAQGGGAAVRAGLIAEYEEIIGYYGATSGLMQRSPWPEILARLRAEETVLVPGWELASHYPVAVADLYRRFRLGADDTVEVADR